MHDPKTKFDNSGESFEQDVADLYGIPKEDDEDEKEDEEPEKK
jgi:hypothetical protein